MDEEEIKATLAQVRAGDEGAASALLEYMNPLVMQIVWRRCPAGMAEEDMAQEIFIRVFKNLNQFRGKVPFKHWVSRIAVNTCITHLAKAKKRRFELRKADLSEEQEAVLDMATADERAEAPDQKTASLELLERLLSHLEPKDRLILELKELEEKSVKEISQITGWSEVNVRVRAMRAKAKLRNYWQELLKSEKR